jgi:hypothetical protein
MPIDDSELETRFIVADASSTIDGLRQRVGHSAATLRYVIVRFPDGRFSVPSLYELRQAAEKLGPAVLDYALADVPPSVVTVGAVDQSAVSPTVARRERDRQPNRRLVVVREGQPVGLLTNERRGGSASGAPLDLFGPFMRVLPREELRRRLEDQGGETTCRFCSRPFKFYELRTDVGAYACPHCHAIQSPWGAN